MRRGSRIIPARAGFTQPWRSQSRWWRGSSPLARGLRQVGGDLPARLRIIPARAGFTRARSRSRGRGRDHPRSRGVYFDSFRSDIHRGGSSPLARGLRRPPGDRRRRGRIIPARAGFTVAGLRGFVPDEDHPRSRGVYPASSRSAITSSGSSPLARGLQLDFNSPSRSFRIIPARAGFTHEFRGLFGWKKDHPRSRGVYLPLTSPHGASSGSSPLARGLPGCVEHGG